MSDRKSSGPSHLPLAGARSTRRAALHASGNRAGTNRIECDHRQVDATTGRDSYSLSGFAHSECEIQIYPLGNGVAGNAHPGVPKTFGKPCFEL